MITTYRLRQILVIAFCLWHMAAVGLYLVPENGFVRFRRLQRLTKPYVQLFSQWQKWDIFAPDPLRRVSTYRVEKHTGDNWTTVVHIDPEHVSWWQSAKEMKVLGRLEEEWKILAPSYLKAYCNDVGVKTDVDIRLVAESFMLPRRHAELRHLSHTSPETTEKIMAAITCPRSS